MAAMNYSRIASLYDTYVQTDFDFQFFLDETSEISGEVLELMSGTGRVSIPLIEAGRRLTCIDSSSEMLNILRKKMKRKGISVDAYEMDVCQMSLGKQFDFIFIPFHSFAEIVSASEQEKALRAIYQHLTDAGRFICTLHNPSIRLQTVNGQLRLIGKYPLAGNRGTLLFWGLENYYPTKHIVDGFQLYEQYDDNGVMRSRTIVDLQFYLHEKEDFELLIKEVGLKVTSLYGDYSRTHFQADKSPFMIWTLQKT